MNKSKLLLGLAIALFCFSACKKDDDGDKPYVGKWASNIYASQNLNTGAYILEKMTFEFTNTSFTDEIAQSTSLTDNNLTPQVSFGGDISNDEGSTLNVSIQTLSLAANGASADRAQDETTFNALYALSIEALLSLDFEATFELYSNNDSMKLTIPVKVNGPTTTIRLGKQK